uniref:Uncharacterized protein n=1 Tax=Arundo donax TaxID=35708 RepID=A0A0A9GM91_ARUDO
MTREEGREELRQPPRNREGRRKEAGGGGGGTRLNGSLLHHLHLFKIVCFRRTEIFH